MRTPPTNESLTWLENRTRSFRHPITGNFSASRFGGKNSHPLVLSVEELETNQPKDRALQKTCSLNAGQIDRPVGHYSLRIHRIEERSPFCKEVGGDADHTIFSWQRRNRIRERHYVDTEELSQNHIITEMHFFLPREE